MNPFPHGFKLFVIPPQTDCALVWQLVAPSGTTVRLTDQQGAIMSQLLGRYGKPVYRTNLIEALWGDDPEGGPLNPAGVIRVQLNNIRRIFRALGVDLDCRPTWGHNDKSSAYTLKNICECKPFGKLPRYYRAPVAPMTEQIRMELERKAAQLSKVEAFKIEEEEIFFGYRSVGVNKCYEAA